MQTSQTIPDIFYRLQSKFGVRFDTIAITIGNVCHTADKDLFQKRPDIEIHENVHRLQQEKAGDVEMWWDLYMDNPDFRLKEEIQAYQAQARYIKEFAPDLNKNFKMLQSLARELSGPTYGNLLSFSEAYRIIKSA